MNDAPKQSQVDHAKLRCTCASCIADRQAEVRRRQEEQRREDRRIALAVLEDARGRGEVFRLKKAQPGSQRALRKLGGGR